VSVVTPRPEPIDWKVARRNPKPAPQMSRLKRDMLDHKARQVAFGEVNPELLAPA